MSDDRYRRVADLYQAAQDRRPEERSSFVMQAAAGDSDLRREVESLLAQDDKSIAIDEHIAGAARSLLADNSGVQPTGIIGPYRIDSLLGVGGMGEVYRATDTNLKRQVAIKVLPASVARDAERLARFQREAEVLAVLNHPNIAHVYGLERSNETIALVMELVEGPTLADRIAKGAISIDEALPIAKQIAEALDAAHEQGIIHRDLKPANIKVRDDDTVKVLDFGLAKAMEPTGVVSPSVTMSPTITSPAMTQAGIILGTAAYMSPEQAKGRPADKRSDVWAFGCVFYEMLAGQRAFGGEEWSDTLAHILLKEPDWAALPTDTPASIRRLLARCLKKDRKLRLDSVAAARLEIEEALAVPAGDETVASSRSTTQRQRVMSLIAAIVTGALLGAGALRAWIHPAPTARPLVTRLSIPIGAHNQFSAIGRHLIALSPDGTRLVYNANQQLYLRPLDSLEAVTIRGTGLASQTNANAGRSPFFSPDGKWLGFYQDGWLRKVLVDGGTPVEICEAATPFGATWATDNTILYGEGLEGIYRVSADGGKPSLVVPKPGGLAHGPQLLPGGHAVLFTLRGETDAWDNSQIVVQSLETGHRDVLGRGTDARYLETGHLVYVAEGTLFAIPFDVTTLKVSGGPVSLVEHIAQSPIQTGAAHFSISRTGWLAYIPGSFRPIAQQTLVWLDRQGHETPLGVPARGYIQARISPEDESRIAVVIAGGGRRIWIWDAKRETLTPLTASGGFSDSPVWTRDGQRIAFSWSGLWLQAADGSGSPERLTDISQGGMPSQGGIPTSFAPDGRLVFTTGDNNRLALLTPGPARRVDSLIGPPGQARNGEVSPDGRFLAYETTESGQSQVLVRPFPKVEAGRWQVSGAGGTRPAWSHDGTELFYVAPSGGLMRVQMLNSATPIFSAPTKLVESSFSFSLPVVLERSYDVSWKGDRFLVMKPAQNPEPQEEPNEPNTIVVVQNWFEELKARVPTK